jgi:hypothetical protein
MTAFTRLIFELFALSDISSTLRDGGKNPVSARLENKSWRSDVMSRIEETDIRFYHLSKSSNLKRGSAETTYTSSQNDLTKLGDFPSVRNFAHCSYAWTSVRRSLLPVEKRNRAL